MVNPSPFCETAYTAEGCKNRPTRPRVHRGQPCHRGHRAVMLILADLMVCISDALSCHILYTAGFYIFRERTGKILHCSERLLDGRDPTFYALMTSARANECVNVGRR